MIYFRLFNPWTKVNSSNTHMYQMTWSDWWGRSKWADGGGMTGWPHGKGRTSARWRRGRGESGVQRCQFKKSARWLQQTTFATYTTCTGIRQAWTMWVVYKGERKEEKAKCRNHNGFTTIMQHAV